jgi:hypothetical protein
MAPKWKQLLASGLRAKLRIVLLAEQLSDEYFYMESTTE